MFFAGDADIEMTDVDKIEEKVSEINCRKGSAGVASTVSRSGNAESDSDQESSSNRDKAQTKTNTRDKPNPKDKAQKDDSGDLVGPPMPPGFKPVTRTGDSNKDEDSSDDDIGPPLPPGFEPAPPSKTAASTSALQRSNADKKDNSGDGTGVNSASDSEDDSDSESEEEEEVRTCCVMMLIRLTN